jgi:hypothetical protein
MSSANCCPQIACWVLAGLGILYGVGLVLWAWIWVRTARRGGQSHD